MVKIHKNTHRILYTKVGFVCIFDIVLVCAKSSNLLRFSSARKGMGREHSLPDPRSYRRIEIFVCSCEAERWCEQGYGHLIRQPSAATFPHWGRLLVNANNVTGGYGILPYRHR